MMFYYTTAAKDIQWKSHVNSVIFPVKDIHTETIHHLDYIEKFYD